MKERSIMIERFATYSKTNILLLVDDRLSSIALEILERSGRDKILTIVADNMLIYDIIRAAKLDAYNGMLVRRFDKFTPVNQLKFCDEIIKNSAIEKGKFILTATKFDAVAPQVAGLACKIQTCTILTAEETDLPAGGEYVI